MADVKISALPAATTPLAGSEVLPIVQSGATVKVSVDNLTAGKTVAAATVNVDANSDTSAVRITQTGTGNAILVEDSANPDSTPFLVNGSGNVGVGTLSPDALLTVNGIASFGDGAVSTPSIAHAGDLNTGFWFPAADTIAASTSGSERIRFLSTGAVGIGTSSAGGYSGTVNLSGSGSPTGGYLEGFSSNQTASSSVTDRFDAYLSAPSTAAASFTLANLMHYRAQQGTFGVNSTVTNQFGFHAAVNIIGATYNYGFYGDIPAAAGRWNFYANGTADNYFAGNVGIATNAPTRKLDVNDNGIRVRNSNTPASATAAGNAGDICWDANYIYVCTATNTWKRVAIATW